MPTPPTQNRDAQVRLAVLAVAVVAGLSLGAVVFALYLPAVPSSLEGAVVTSDGAMYFAGGYYSHRVNFSLTHSGDVIQLGPYSFLYTTPTNLETRTMTVGSGGAATTTVAVVTADYQCGTSLGQRRFFFVQGLGGADGPAYTLDYCLVLNTAVAQGAVQGGVAHPWDIWQIAPSSPAVAIHMSGTGESVSLVELCVSK